VLSAHLDAALFLGHGRPLPHLWGGQTSVRQGQDYTPGLSPFPIGYSCGSQTREYR